MNNKKLPVRLQSKLELLSSDAQALFLSLWLKADEAGITPMINERSLIPLSEAGLIVATNDKIVLRSYLSSNYSPILKPDYNPHKRPLAVIAKHGLTYNPETSEIDIDSNNLIDLDSSLDKLDNTLSPTLATNVIDKPLDGKLLAFVKSQNFALLLACLLMLVQSFHSSHALADLTTLADPLRMVFAISTAILMDCLIIYFVANGERATSFIFFGFCALLNIYAYHMEIDYMTYRSFFAFVPALAVPYAVHCVSSQMKLETPLL